MTRTGAKPSSETQVRTIVALRGGRTGRNVPQGNSSRFQCALLGCSESFRALSSAGCAHAKQWSSAKRAAGER